MDPFRCDVEELLRQIPQKPSTSMTESQLIKLLLANKSLTSSYGKFMQEANKMKKELAENNAQLRRQLGKVTEVRRENQGRLGDTQLEL